MTNGSLVQLIQSVIALTVTAAVLVGVLTGAIGGAILTNVFFLVIGFYFNRTNALIEARFPDGESGRTKSEGLAQWQPIFHR